MRQYLPQRACPRNLRKLIEYFPQGVVALGDNERPFVITDITWIGVSCHTLSSALRVPQCIADTVVVFFKLMRAALCSSCRL